jgi:hypothetical protein
MARMNQGILGGLSGKVGNVVGGTWKGISYLRALPASVKDAKSIKQRTSRLKMHLVVQFLQTCTDFIRIGFKGYAIKMSAFNAATSYNYYNGIAGEYPDLVYDYAGFLVSRGKLTAVNDATCFASAALRISVSWGDNTGDGNARSTDTAMMLVFNPEKTRSVYLLQGAIRSDGSVEMDVPRDFRGDEVHCYLSFADFGNLVTGQSKDYVSNSVYAGSVTVT